MNKYEEILDGLIYETGSEGSWFKNDMIKIGVSFAECYIDDGILIHSEEDAILISDSYENWEEVFGKNEDLKFVITLECAESQNFVTWQEFKDAIDGDKQLNIATL